MRKPCLPKISIVAVSDSITDTLPLLFSLNDVNYAQLELILVMTTSANDQPVRVRPCSVASVKIIFASSDPTVTDLVRQGVQQATGDLTFLLPCDTALPADWLELIFHGLKKDTVKIGPNRYQTDSTGSLLSHGLQSKG